jgi:hypothetical protein
MIIDDQDGRPHNAIVAATSTDHISAARR